MKLREQLISQDDSIRKLLDEKDELEGMLRGYEQQLSTKEKEYDAFREIISNMEEDIMEFRS
jgi:phage shock protein A